MERVNKYEDVCLPARVISVCRFDLAGGLVEALGTANAGSSREIASFCSVVCGMAAAR